MWLKSINEACNVMQRTSRRIISSKLVHKFREAIDIILDRSGLTDAIELTKVSFVLNAIEECVQSAVEIGPLQGFDFLCDGLDPALGWSSELHT